MTKTLLREDKNGTKYYGCVDRCCKCQGTGIISYYIPINGGECFECGGSGIVEWEEKEYTPEYEAKLQAQREKREAKKLEKAKAQAAEKNAEFFKNNGFTADGITYFVLGNTYEIKEELKAQGAKWDNISNHWHMPVKPEGREVFEVSVDEMYEKDYSGTYHWNCWKTFDCDDQTHYSNRIKATENKLKAQNSTSQHVGQIGEKLEVIVTYTHTAQWSNNYGSGYWTEGVTNLHSFKDEQGNIYTWKTGTFIDADYGTQMRLKGTVKDHSEYKGIKQTVLTRCKVEAI